MDVLTRIRAGGREIHCGLATTRHERAAAQAQRFRVYQRRGYYRPGLHTDRDAYDNIKATAYFLALLPTGHRRGVLLGSARVILGGARAGFRFPAEQAFEFELPETIAAIGASQRVEVTRVVAELVQGIVIGGLLTPLGLIQAISEYVRPLGIRCGLSVIKRRFLRVLQGLGVRLHELQPARLIYPSDGPVARYYHRHPDPVVPVYWLVDEIAPSVEEAISVYGSTGYAAAHGRPENRGDRPIERTARGGVASAGTAERPDALVSMRDSGNKQQGNAGLVMKHRRP